MPEHTSFFSYLLALFPALGENMTALGHTLTGQPVTVHGAEPLAASLFVAVLVILLAIVTRSRIVNLDDAVIPENRLSLRTFMEIFIAYFYDMMKDMMGAKRAKRYFPLVGTFAMFILFSNLMGLVPGLNPPTSSLNVTAGCAIIVFVMFNYYGIKENGLHYFKHLLGPVWWLAPLILPIEILSLCVRPVTLAVRLMMNMAVDHLLAGIMLALFALLLPIPLLVLGTLVCLIQVLVFCLLTSIYITLATEHEEHDESHGHPAPAGAALPAH
jgi:F-type H+-transporting ATPase subunit a